MSTDLLIEMGWKPILIFRKPPIPKCDDRLNFIDILYGAGRKKSNHPWEQPIEESKRLMSTIQEYMIETKRADGLFVKDTDTVHRKYLYDLLEKNGFDKKKFYRQSTTFSERK